jgi:hypothetical protein
MACEDSRRPVAAKLPGPAYLADICQDEIVLTSEIQPKAQWTIRDTEKN